MVYGEPLQIVEVDKDGKLMFHRQKMDAVITQCGDIPLAVYTVAGEFRKGKTTILNIFLAFNHFRELDKDWRTEKETKLTGFDAKGGSVKVTNGIWVWSKPFFGVGRDGKKLAIILMDTQGTFDQDTSSEVNSFIFGFSLAVSSILMFNNMNRISSHDVDSLVTFGSTFTPIVGKFQTLSLLVRDWNDEERFYFGWEGGQKMVDDLVNPGRGVDKQVRAVRSSVKDLFDNVTGFLLPPPGTRVVNSKKEIIKIGYLDPSFEALADDLCKEIFVTNVEPFVHKGKHLTADQWAGIFDHLVKAYKEGKIMDPGFHKDAFSGSSAKSIKDSIIAVYQNNMMNAVMKEMQDRKLSFVPETFLKMNDSKFRMVAIDSFKEQTKHFGRQDAIEDQLMQEMAKWFDDRKREYDNISKAHAKLEKLKIELDNEVESSKLEAKRMADQLKNFQLEAQLQIAEARKVSEEAAHEAQERFERKEQEMRETILENNERLNMSLIRLSEEKNKETEKFEQMIQSQNETIRNMFLKQQEDEKVRQKSEIERIAREEKRRLEDDAARQAERAEYKETLVRLEAEKRQDIARTEQMIQSQNEMLRALADRPPPVVKVQSPGCLIQ